MWRQAGLPITGGLLCLLAATPVNAAHPASFAPPAGPPLAPRTHGFMLYLSQPMGGGSGGAALQPKFGFRIDQVRMMGNSGAPDAGDPIQRRALIGWQFNCRSGMQPADMRLELGGRVSYDVTHGGFAIQSSRPGAESGAVDSGGDGDQPPACSGWPTEDIRAPWTGVPQSGLPCSRGRA